MQTGKMVRADLSPGFSINVRQMHSFNGTFYQFSILAAQEMAIPKQTTLKNLTSLFNSTISCMPLLNFTKRVSSHIH